jgi:GT2 family glycosyltransferase
MGEPAGGQVSDAARERLPPASLILASRNRPGLLSATVASILEADELPSELIIVDQSDTPNTELAGLASPPGCAVRYRPTRSTGLSRANNEGVAAAHHDVLVFTHDDVRVTPGWFGTLVRALERAGPRAVVTGRVLPGAVGEGFAPSTISSEVSRVYEGRIGMDILYPMSLALYRSALEETGPFDERLGPGTPFPAAEDNELAHRLLEAGYRIVYDADAVLYHLAWRTRREYLPLKWSYGRGQGAFYGKHIDLRDRYVLWRFARELTQRSGRFLRLLPRQPRRAAGQIVCAFGVISGFTQWLLTRPRD